jgi:hypothetical protein
MKYGVRDVVDVVLRAKGTMDLGNKRFYKNEPVLYFDTLTTSTLEGASTTVYAQGGKGNARLMAWEGERTVTFTMEDALISPESLSILTGAGLIEASESAPIYQHIVETTDNYELAGEELTIVVDKEPFINAGSEAENENYVCVMFTKDGEIISEPYIVDQGAEVVAGEDGYTIKVNSHECNFRDNCDNGDRKEYKAADLATDFGRSNGILVDYYTPVKSGAKQIEIDAEKFAGSYYLEGSTLWRDTNGVDHPAEFVIPNCKIQSNFTFTMDAFPDYTRFDHTHKVFAQIQIMESQTAASDAHNDLHRGRTWHADGVVATEIQNASMGHNHDLEEE